MLEFINFEMIKALMVLYFALGLLILSFRVSKKKKNTIKQGDKSKKSSHKYYWFTIMLFFITIVLFEADSSMMDAKQSVNKFRGAKVIRCTTKENKYRVSKEDGWEVERFYFIKSSLMIRADKCEDI